MSLPDPDLARRIKAISSVFEVGSPEPDYGYVENLDDGRGFTVTQYGFCTYNTEVAEVIQRIVSREPGTPLKSFLPKLPPQDWDGHDLGDFAAMWRREAKASKALAEACDEAADTLYLAPAVTAAASVGVNSPVGIAIFYDTLVQHGDGDDPELSRRDHEGHPVRAGGRIPAHLPGCAQAGAPARFRQGDAGRLARIGSARGRAAGAARAQP